MLPALAVLLVAVAFQRGLTVLDDMLRCGMPKERIFALLRANGIEQLGQVRRVSFETSGQLSVFRNPEPAPGLSIIPGVDEELLAEAERAPDRWASTECGRVEESRDGEPQRPCPRCGSSSWTPAILRVGVRTRGAEGSRA